jgi:hypothetical protein
MPGVTRRQLLQTGFAGGALLALAACARSNTPLVDDTYRYRMLTAGDRELVAAVAAAMLAGALPGDATARQAALVRAVRGVDVAIAGLPEHVVDELRQLFGLLEFAPTRGFTAGIWTQWSLAGDRAVTQFLTRWRFSGVSLFRSGYQALHQLVMAAWYGGAPSWSRIGFPGPPNIG